MSGRDFYNDYVGCTWVGLICSVETEFTNHMVPISRMRNNRRHFVCVYWNEWDDGVVMQTVILVKGAPLLRGKWLGDERDS